MIEWKILFLCSKEGRTTLFERQSPGKVNTASNRTESQPLAVTGLGITQSIPMTIWYFPLIGDILLSTFEANSSPRELSLRRDLLSKDSGYKFFDVFFPESFLFWKTYIINFFSLILVRNILALNFLHSTMGFGCYR